MRFASRFGRHPRRGARTAWATGMRRPPPTSQPRPHHLADSRQADDQRRALRNVDDAPAAERSAVVDPHDHGAAGALVRDLEAGAEGHAAMGGPQRLAVEALAVRGAAAVMRRPVPGGLAALNAAAKVGAEGFAAPIAAKPISA